MLVLGTKRRDAGGAKSMVLRAVMFTEVTQSSVLLPCTRGLSRAQCPSEGCAFCMADPQQSLLPAKPLFVDRGKCAISWFDYNEFS